MTAANGRLELFVDVFDQESQRAWVLPTLTPRELVAAILAEFQEIAYLGTEPSTYRLQRRGDGPPLDPTQPLAGQVADQERLYLAELAPPMPAGAREATQPLYLREERAGTLFRIHWHPAVVGRVSEGDPQSEWVAVDLRSFPTAKRASRRHLKLWEEEGHCYVANLSSNPATLLRPDQPEQPLLLEAPLLLHPGDTLRLDRAGILLRVLVRPSPPPSPESGLGEQEAEP